MVSWARVEYSWPDRRPKELANLTIMPIAAKTGLINGERYIKEIIYNRGDYRYLPMLYNSAVSRELIEKLKSKTGRVFNAISPDIYSGYAFAYLSKKYLSVGYPLTINGVSSASNGAAHTNSDEKIKADFRNLHTVSEIQWPRNLPDFYTSYIGIIEPFIQLSTFLPDLKKYISLKGVYKIIIDSLESVDEKDLETKLQKITESSRHDVNLFKWVKSYINKTKPVHKPVVIIKLNERIGFDGSHLILDASDFGVKNVDDMSIFINKMFGNIKDQIFLKPVRRNLVARLKRAAGIIIKGQ